MPSHEMIIHDIRVDGDRRLANTREPYRVLVGATDMNRWEWELEDATSAVNATTLVYVCIEDRGQSFAPIETCGLHVAREDPLREPAIASISFLFEAAWEIWTSSWTQSEAQRAVYGRKVDKQSFLPNR